MTILLVGSGAREHAIARAIKKSAYKSTLVCFGSSVNPMIKKISGNYKVGSANDCKAIVNFARENNVDFAIIGPEIPLSLGIADDLEEIGIPCVGPKKKSAKIESSKSFARFLSEKYCSEVNPRFKQFNSIEGVEKFLLELNGNYVVKADGLMGGKGVKVSGDHLKNDNDAISYCKSLIAQNNNFVIEEKLVGEEFSLMSFCDGSHLCHMPAVQDHKRAFEGDAGPNTGGMGSYSDANHLLPFLTEQDVNTAHKINERIAFALEQETGEKYKGILYGGFMATGNGIKLIEYNARFGDPEAMNVLSILKTDFIEICWRIINGNLPSNGVKFANKATVCKYAVPNGYPDNPITNEKIHIDEVKKKENLYLAAVDQRFDGLYETGSRTVAIVGIAETIELAEAQAESEINLIKGPLYHRSDIGKKYIKNRKQTNIKQNAIKLAILGSTNGTDMEAIVRAINKHELNAEISIVISNKKNAGILEKALNHNLRGIYISKRNDDKTKKTEEQYDSLITQELDMHKIDLIVLIGYMRILSAEFVKKYRKKIINVHPSLLPAFAGGMDLDVHKQVIESGTKETGCTVHYVEEEVDSGEIIIQKKCRVESNDTPETLKNKVQELEGSALIEAINIHLKKNMNKDARCDCKKESTPIKRVLISVSDKTGIVELAKNLCNIGVEIISTGGTAKLLDKSGIKNIKISDFTGFQEMMDGRVKTMHPMVHAGILGLRDKHAQEAEQHNIKWIDMVVCNLYPFEATIKKQGVKREEIIENIDIGGPTMIRSAAKNVNWVCAVVDPDDYSKIAEEINQCNGICCETRQRLSAKAFTHTAHYDSIIAGYFQKEKFPSKLTLAFEKYFDPRYGENPHQQACVYSESNFFPYINQKPSNCNILNAKILQGKQLSYNNINDADGALSCLKEFENPCAIIVKHANPCGVAECRDITSAFKKAHATDPLSSFGGIIALNRTCTAEIAEEIVKMFAEIVIAPDFESSALSIFEKKKKMRLLEIGPVDRLCPKLEFRHVEGGILCQDLDINSISIDNLDFVTEKKPTIQEKSDMIFAWKVLKHVKSNAILIAKDNTTISIGPGQVSRVDAVEIAIKKSASNTEGAVLASDAFFPFRDSIDMIAQDSQVKAIIQPGGSIKDSEVITACNELGIAMSFTNIRCFKH
ncbi:MAG: bifunctional phosphoribosylaminoimidazolecarboxamide formyltransferase/IMP cyclohydrolase [bacterium]